MYSALILLSFGAILSCGNNDEKSRKPEARTLYEKSLQISKLYLDSLKFAKDSAEVERLSKAYEEAITNLNYSYPPDLGLEISEGENDTLTNITLKYVALRDSLLYRFAHGSAGKAELNDSIPDSLKEKSENSSKSPNKEEKKNKEKPVNKETKEKKENTVKTDKTDNAVDP